MQNYSYSLIGCFFLGLWVVSCSPSNDPPSIPSEPHISFKMVYDEIGGKQVVVVGSSADDLIVSFERKSEGGMALEFLPTSQRLPVIMEDTEGNSWDVFGKSISGPRKGERLKRLEAIQGYWFALASMYPGIEVYSMGSLEALDSLEVADGWSIPTENVAWGSAWDAIPPLDHPKFLRFKQRDYLETSFYLSQEDRIIGLEVDGEIRAYSHAILEWHEVVNDQVGGEPLTLSYCPLAGTATAWKGSSSGESVTYGVSGLLHNNNLMLFDRGTESIWSQITGECVYGEQRSISALTYPLVETSWKTWLKILNEPEILSTETGVQRDYTQRLYEGYASDEDQIFYPLDYFDSRLPSKERVYMIKVGEAVKVYRSRLF